MLHFKFNAIEVLVVLGDCWVEVWALCACYQLKYRLFSACFPLGLVCFFCVYLFKPVQKNQDDFSKSRRSVFTVLKYARYYNSICRDDKSVP